MNMFYDNKIFRFINKNRGGIILVIAMVIFGVLIIKVLNAQAGARYNQANTNNTENAISNEVRKSQDTIISNTTIDDEEANTNYSLISTFTEYCNNKEIDKAYDLLTDECKKTVYPSVESFNKNYIQVVFKEKKYSDIQSWIQNEGKCTYIVKFTGDIITTGNNDEKEYQDYITIDEESKKLNINRYIGREKVNKTQEIENIKFEIDFVDLYKDYEIYHLKVSNQNNRQIILDDLSSTTSTYIETDKETKINCSNYEAGANSFKLNAGVSKDIKLKFIRQYNPDILDERLVFSSAILDTENNENIKEVSIEL